MHLGGLGNTQRRIRTLLGASWFCQESSVLQNRTVVDLSVACNDDRWRISYISILPCSVPDSCKPGLLAFASHWLAKTWPFWDLSSYIVC